MSSTSSQSFKTDILLSDPVNSRKVVNTSIQFTDYLLINDSNDCLLINDGGDYLLISD